MRNSAVLDRPASSITATPPNSIREEAAATGQRMKGAVKDAAGAVTGNERLEREGERENAEGRIRQAENDAVSAPGTPAHLGLELVERAPRHRLYEKPEQARQAHHDLTTRHGYKDDDISVVMTDETPAALRRRHARHGVQGRHESSRGRRHRWRHWAGHRRRARASWRRRRRLRFLASVCSSRDRSLARSPVQAPAARPARCSGR